MSHAGSTVTISLPVIITAAIIVGLALLGFTGWLVYRELCKRTIDRLEYRRTFSEDGVYEGDSVTLTERIYNPTRLPLFRAYAESYFFPDNIAQTISAPMPMPKPAMKNVFLRSFLVL